MREVASPAEPIQALLSRLEDSARLGGATELDIFCLRQLLLGQRHFDTLALAMRINEIEKSLSDRTPHERRSIVCERLQLSRSRYFELRSLVKEIVPSPVRDRTDGL